LHPKLSKPLKADPSSGPDGDPASRSVVTSHGCGRRLPAPPTERLRKTPSVNGDAVYITRTIMCVKCTASVAALSLYDLSFCVIICVEIHTWQQTCRSTPNSSNEHWRSAASAQRRPPSPRHCRN